MLNKMGASVDGAGTDVIVIEGKDELHPVDHAIIPDRIEAGTYMVAAACHGRRRAARGRATSTTWTRSPRSCAPRACTVEREGSACACRASRPFTPVDVTTAPHPGFPTDMQAQFMVLHVLRHRPERDHRDHLREPLHARAAS